MDSNHIVGAHSILEAIANPSRSVQKILATSKGWEEIRKKLNRDQFLSVKDKIETLSPHVFQEKCKEIYKDHDFNYSRVPGGVLLICSTLPLISAQEIYQSLDSGSKKIVVLDQVTDIQNAAAILRTASFYGVDVLVLPLKGSPRFNPSFFRIASGATEHIPLHLSSNISKFIKKLQERGAFCIGLSEHAKVTLEENLKEANEDQSLCLVLGSEDAGLSHAVDFSLERKGRLETKGKMQSLNVSVAAAVSMEKVFG